MRRFRRVIRATLIESLAVGAMVWMVYATRPEPTSVTGTAAGQRAACQRWPTAGVVVVEPAGASGQAEKRARYVQQQLQRASRALSNALRHHVDQLLERLP